MSHRVGSLTALLASNCTLRCTYCYQQPGGSLVMPWPVLRAALDVVLSSSSDRLAVEFSGGEPLLAYPLLQKGVRYLEARAGGRQVRFEITTNGTLLSSSRLDYLEAHGFTLKLSYHPVPGARDPRGRAEFVRLDRLLDGLRRRSGLWRDHLQIAVTVGARELPRLAATIRYLMRNDARHIGMSAAFQPSAWRPGDIVRVEEQFERITRMVADHRDRTGLVPVAIYRGPEADAAVRPRRGAEPDLRCGGAGGAAIAVDPTGRAWACVMLAGTRPQPRAAGSGSPLELPDSSPLWRFSLGDVRDPDFGRRLPRYASRIAATRVFPDRLLQRSSYGRCRRCPHLAICPVCPVASAFGPASVDPRRVSDFVCAFTRVSWEHASRLPPAPGLADRLAGRAPAPLLARELHDYAQRVRSGSA